MLEQQFHRHQVQKLGPNLYIFKKSQGISLNLHFKIATFYEFKTVDNLQYLLKSLKIFCKTNQLLGTIIIAPEGMNGTMAGLPTAIDDFTNYVKLFVNYMFIDISQNKSCFKTS